MFNSTHTLVGFSLSRAGLDRWAPHAAWTAVVAANLPDIDIVAELHSTTAYIAYHRGITHTAIGILLLSLALAGIMHWISGKFRRHFLIALVAMATHPLLDYTNSYGVRPWYPLSHRWTYGDMLFVIDPYVDLMLLGGLLLGSYLKKRKLAIIGLAAVVAYIGARTELRNMAREKLGEYTATLSGLQRSAVLPETLSPFAWTGIVETAGAISMVDVNVWTGVGKELAELSKSPDPPAVIAAKKTRAGSVFMGFARFPVARVDSGPDGYRVLLIDARFYRPATRTAFAAEIRLDRAMRVVSEDMGFNSLVN